MQSRYSQVDEVYERGVGWKPAPEPKHIGESQDYFVAHHRCGPSGNILDASTWLELRHSGLIRAMKALFPSYGGLYDRAPGVGWEMTSLHIVSSS